MTNRKYWPKVAVVTPIHNGINHTIPYLKSLQKVDYPNYETIIVDDGSTDNSATSIKEAFPKVIILTGDGNLWWSGATNLGVKSALERKADYVFTINNDVLVDPQVLKAAVACAEENPRSIIGCKINYAEDPKRVWFFGAKFDRRSGKLILIEGKDSDFTKITAVDMLTGMGMLIPSLVFSEVGFFDEKKLPQYYADSDLPLRAKRLGYKSLVTPAAKVSAYPESSWMEKQMEKKGISIIPAVLFTRRSPFSISRRFIFYHRYWGKGYIIALTKSTFALLHYIVVHMYRKYRRKAVI